MDKILNPKFEIRISFIFSIFLLPFFLFLASCCTGCLIARSEMAGQEDLEQANPKATEVWAGDIDSVITSEYGGNLQSFKVDDVSPLLQLPGYYNSDLLMSCDSGRQLGIREVTQYDSSRKATVKISSLLTNPELSLEKTFRMNFDTGDVYINKEIVNSSDEPLTVDIVQKLTLEKGGFFLIPINVSSRYPSLYKITDQSGNDITAQVSENVLRVDNKIAYYASQNDQFTISADSTEGWFGYFYKDTLLLVKFSPFYTNQEKKDSLVFKADVTKDAIICTFGETSRNLPEKNSRLKLYEKLAIIKLKGQINNFGDIETALNYLKVNLIVRR